MAHDSDLTLSAHDYHRQEMSEDKCLRPLVAKTMDL